jgi:hypothetical protein
MKQDVDLERRKEGAAPKLSVDSPTGFLERNLEDADHLLRNLLEIGERLRRRSYIQIGHWSPLNSISIAAAVWNETWFPKVIGPSPA